MEDPFSGLPEIPYSVTDITDKGSEDLDRFYFSNSFFSEIESSEDGSMFINVFKGPGIMELNPEGKFRGLVTEPGKGPGEYTYTPQLEVTREGELVMMDSGNMKISIFRRSSITWVLVDEFSIPLKEGYRYAELHPLKGGQIGIEYRPNINPNLILEEIDTTFYHEVDIIDRGGNVIRKSVVMSDLPEISIFKMGSTGSIVSNVPFSPRQIIRSSSDSVIYRLSTSDFTVEIFNSAGNIKKSISYPAYTVEIPDSVKLSRAEGGASPGTDEDKRKMTEAILKKVPNKVPPVNDFYVDNITGLILIGRDELYEGPKWLLLNAVGKRLGTLDLGPYFRIEDFSNERIAGYLDKENTPPTVRVIELELLGK